MRILIAALASLVILSCGSTYAQSCYSQQFQGSLSTVYPQTQTFSTVHTVNVPVQVEVQHQVVSQVVAQAPLVVPQCNQSLGAVYGNSSCGTGAVRFGSNFQSYGHSFNGGFNGGFNNGFRGFNQVSHFNSGFNSGFVGGFGAVGGGGGVSISARDRNGTQVIANGANNVRINRGLLGRINGASADRQGGLLGGLLPF
jgi:hypothetical protein